MVLLLAGLVADTQVVDRFELADRRISRWSFFPPGMRMFVAQVLNFAEAAIALFGKPRDSFHCAARRGRMERIGPSSSNLVRAATGRGAAHGDGNDDGKIAMLRSVTCAPCPQRA